MKRRMFLEATSAGVAAALWPAWLREAFADEPTCDKGWAARVAQVAAAFARGREAGKPLLVFVIPADDAEKWTRGETFGELLNHGSDHDLAPLAGVEVTCATMADLKKLVPTAGAGEPLMVLVDPSRVPATARQIDTELPPYPDLYKDHMTWEEREKAEDEISESPHRRDGQDAPRRARRRVRATIAASPRSPPTCARASATSRCPGSHWAHASGCGVRIEGETDSMGYACGMGHTPKKSQRFLYFFTKRAF